MTNSTPQPIPQAAPQAEGTSRASRQGILLALLSLLLGLLFSELVLLVRPGFGATLLAVAVAAVIAVRLAQLGLRPRPGVLALGCLPLLLSFSCSLFCDPVLSYLVLFFLGRGKRIFSLLRLRLPGGGPSRGILFL